MYTVLVILILVAAFLMIGIVLIQESKGGGLSSSFASYNQIGGVRKTTNFIEKATWGLVITMAVLSVACAYFAPEAKTNTSVMEGVENAMTNPNNMPGFGASQTKQQAAPAGQKAEADGAQATEKAAPAAENAAAAPATDSKKAEK